MTGKFTTDPEDTSNLGRTAARGFGWFVGGRLFNVVINLGVTAVLARLLVPADFGMYGVILVVLGLSQTLYDGAFCIPLVQRKTVTPDFITASFLGACAIAGISILVIVLLSGSVERLMGFDGLAPYLQVTSFALLPACLAAVFTSMMQRLHAFKTLNIAASLAYVFGFAAVAVPMAAMDYGLWALIGGRFGSSVLELIVLAALRRFPIAWRMPSWADLKDVMGAGSLMSTTSLAGWATHYAPTALIGRALGAEQLGYYNRASNVVFLAHRVTTGSLFKVLVPAAARMENDMERLRKAVLKIFYYVLVPQTALAALMILNADLIVGVLYGPQWLASIPVMKWLFASYLMLCGMGLIDFFLLGMGRTRQVLTRRIVTFILLIAGVMIGTPYGIVAAAQGFFAAYVLAFLYCALYMFVSMAIPLPAFAVLLVRISGFVLLPAFACYVIAGEMTSGMMAGIMASALFCACLSSLFLILPGAVLGVHLTGARTKLLSYLPPRIKPT